MALKFGKGVLRSIATPMQNAKIAHRCIITPPNIGEPTRTNQEVIYDLTRAIIGGRFRKIKS